MNNGIMTAIINRVIRQLMTKRMTMTVMTKREHLSKRPIYVDIAASSF